MIETNEFLLHARIDGDALEAWIEAGWLLPRREQEARQFTEIDVARVQLIRDLQTDCGINDEGIGVILDLLDQMHGLRRTLRGILFAIGTQPEDIRRRIIDQIGAPGGGRAGEETH
ncbi:MAG TPA: chaperone modulator CbpM [Xanthobacteraceae bacterium]